MASGPYACHGIRIIHADGSRYLCFKVGGIRSEGCHQQRIASADGVAKAETASVVRMPLRVDGPVPPSPL